MSCGLCCFCLVPQMGVKAPLEAFKTATKGWGIRATRTIEEGAYICSYAGEVLISLRAVKGSGDGPGLGALVDDSVVVSLVLWSLSGVCFFFCMRVCLLGGHDERPPMSGGFLPGLDCVCVCVCTCA